jgi:hypothetical protein
MASLFTNPGIRLSLCFTRSEDFLLQNIFTSPAIGVISVVSRESVAPGDLLGLFPGQLRYIDQKPTRAISGPVSNIIRR